MLDPSHGDPQESSQTGGPDDVTSMHVRRAQKGDAASLEGLIHRFSPLLLAQAAWRLGPDLRVLYEPQDLVDEVWATALPRLPELSARDGRMTPVVLRFLATTLLYRINNLVRKHLSEAAPRFEPGGFPVSELPAPTTGVTSKVARRETWNAVLAALDELDAADREIIVLRTIEQNSTETVAHLLGISRNAASMRWQRALQRLRARLKGSIFDDLAED